jgi:hypothetical protein
MHTAAVSELEDGGGGGIGGQHFPPRTTVSLKRVDPQAGLARRIDRVAEERPEDRSVDLARKTFARPPSTTHTRRPTSMTSGSRRPEGRRAAERTERRNTAPTGCRTETGAAE